MIESRKKDISKEFIKENVLNKELTQIQWSFLWELNSLKQEIESLKDFNILWSESSSTSTKTQQQEKIFWLDDIMKILFNNKWKQRTKIWYEANKMVNIVYLMISDEWKKNLDLLYESLEKSNTEQELKDSLNSELNKLQSNISQNNQNNNSSNWNNKTQTNIWWYENLNWIENKENNQVSEQYIYQQAKLYWVTDNRQIAYILSTVKWECVFKNIKEIWWENKSYWKMDSKTWNAYYGRWFVQLTHKWNYEKFTKIIKESRLKFKDNNWNILTSQQLDLVKNPDTIIKSNDLASFILIYWMKNGTFTGKKLDDYINSTKTDFKNARRIINWMDKADLFESNAQEYLRKIWN